jgi:hypothetical protein
MGAGALYISHEFRMEAMKLLVFPLMEEKVMLEVFGLIIEIL